jgi:hypothetical protein
MGLLLRRRWLPGSVAVAATPASSDGPGLFSTRDGSVRRRQQRRPRSLPSALQADASVPSPSSFPPSRRESFPTRARTNPNQLRTNLNQLGHVNQLGHALQLCTLGRLHRFPAVSIRSGTRPRIYAGWSRLSEQSAPADSTPGRLPNLLGWRPPDAPLSQRLKATFHDESGRQEIQGADRGDRNNHPDCNGSA